MNTSKNSLKQIIPDIACATRAGVSTCSLNITHIAFLLVRRYRCINISHPGLMLNMKNFLVRSLNKLKMSDNKANDEGYGGSGSSNNVMSGSLVLHSPSPPSLSSPDVLSPEMIRSSEETLVKQRKSNASEIDIPARVQQFLRNQSVIYNEDVATSAPNIASPNVLSSAANLPSSPILPSISILESDDKNGGEVVASNSTLFQSGQFFVRETVKYHESRESHASLNVKKSKVSLWSLDSETYIEALCTIDPVEMSSVSCMDETVVLMTAAQNKHIFQFPTSEKALEWSTMLKAKRDNAMRELYHGLINPDGGHRFCDDFEVVGDAGHGGTSFVKFIVDHHSGIEHVVKIIFAEKSSLTNLTTTDGQVRTVPDEVLVHQMLRHPGILPIVKSYASKKYHALVFNLLPLGAPTSKSLKNSSMRPIDLFTLQERSHPQLLPMKVILDCAKEIGEALVYIHSKGYCHGDIKDENILVWEHLSSAVNRYAVIDFGSSCWKQADGTWDARYSGTIAFKAPELANDEGQLDYRKCDIYSFGLMLFTMIFGFDMRDEGTWNEFESSANNRYKRHGGETVPRGIVDILKSMLAEDPNERTTMFAALGKIKVIVI
eukprot:Partr_v1_DN28488_c0_g1_i1_m41256 putative CAMK family protein kinase